MSKHGRNQDGRKFAVKRPATATTRDSEAGKAGGKKRKPRKRKVVKVPRWA